MAAPELADTAHDDAFVLRVGGTPALTLARGGGHYEPGGSLELMFDQWRYTAHMRGLENGVGGRWRPDGDVRYRYDSNQQLVGILPARCKRRLHSLHVVGYTALERSDYPDYVPYLVITCHECTGPDNAWTLVRTKSRSPDRAELDDEPYRDVVPHFIVNSVEPE